MTITEILESLDAMMLKIKEVADLPGVSLIPYVSTASSVIGAVHFAYAAGKDVTPYLDAVKKTFGVDGTPSVSQIAVLDAKIAALQAEVRAELPTKEEGEPD